MRSSTWLIALALATVATRASATPNFPPAIEQDLGLSYMPDCSLCHTDGDQGGLGTVNTPFGVNMRARGLVAYDTTSLQTALDEMASEQVDSAGDCLDDIDELKAGNDPNAPPTASCTTTHPDADVAAHADAAADAYVDAAAEGFVDGGAAGVDAGTLAGAPPGPITRETPPPPTPTYGCVGRIAPGALTSLDEGGLLAGICALLAIVRRRMSDPQAPNRAAAQS